MFKAQAMSSANFPIEIYPGYPGLVVAGQSLRVMVWGFPLVLKGSKGQTLKPKPVNNARSDKLDGFMWRHSFAERRCLIPVTQFAEAEGEKGSKTRTWFSLPDQPVFAVAGIWRDSVEWGEVYSMVMTESYGPVAEVHDRMPVILEPGRWDSWKNGTPAEAWALLKPYQGSIAVERTTELWVSRKS